MSGSRPTSAAAGMTAEEFTARAVRDMLRRAGIHDDRGITTTCLDPLGCYTTTASDRVAAVKARKAASQWDEDALVAGYEAVPSYQRAEALPGLPPPPEQDDVRFGAWADRAGPMLEAHFRKLEKRAAVELSKAGGPAKYAGRDDMADPQFMARVRAGIERREAAERQAVTKATQDAAIQDRAAAIVDAFDRGMVHTAKSLAAPFLSPPPAPAAPPVRQPVAKQVRGDEPWLRQNWSQERVERNERLDRALKAWNASKEPPSVPGSTLLLKGTPDRIAAALSLAASIRAQQRDGETAKQKMADTHDLAASVPTSKVCTSKQWAPEPFFKPYPQFRR